jgi:hypothetical protein
VRVERFAQGFERTSDIAHPEIPQTPASERRSCVGSPHEANQESHVGSRSIFAAAGFAEVSRPTLRRVVMRIDF